LRQSEPPDTLRIIAILDEMFYEHAMTLTETICCNGLVFSPKVESKFNEPQEEASSVVTESRACGRTHHPLPALIYGSYQPWLERVFLHVGRVWTGFPL